jgi:hypothetical protein
MCYKKNTAFASSFFLVLAELSRRVPGKNIPNQGKTDPRWRAEKKALGLRSAQPGGFIYFCIRIKTYTFPS